MASARGILVWDYFNVDTHLAELIEKRLDRLEEQVRHISGQVTSLVVQIRLGIWLAGALLTGGVALAWRQLANIQKLLGIIETGGIPQ